MFPSSWQSLGKLDQDNKSRRTRLVKRFATLLVIGLIFVFGFLFGRSYSISRQNLDLATFWRVFDLINAHYLHDVDQNIAAEGAVRGLVSSLDDPYSSYLSKEESDALNQDLSGKFQGIGAELTVKEGNITVVTPLKGSPAEAAGVKTDDIILRIDDKTTEKMTLTEAVAAIRGPEGTKVKLTIFRPSTSDSQQLTIIRQKITVESVKSSIEDGTMIISVSQFGEDTAELFAEAVKEAKTQQLQAVIVDLRDNPGGLLNAVPKMVGQFIPPSTVVIERYKSGATEELHSNTIPTLPDLPLYILVNRNSASASEIFTGALQDYRRATVIGERTFGKGVVQEIINLTKGASLRLTVAEWLTPKFREIDGKGLLPTIKISDKRTGSNDPILEKAKELIDAL